MQPDKLKIIEALTGVHSSRKNYYVELQQKIEDVTLCNNQLEKKSQRLEKRFYSMINLLPDCFGLYSPIYNDEGKIGDFIIDYVNKATCQNAQKKKEEFIGHRLSEVMPMNEMLEVYCKVAETGESKSQEAVFYDSNRNITAAWDVRAVKIDDGIAIISRDITNKKMDEEALRLSEERFAKLFHSSPHMMSIIRKSDSRYIDVNQRFLSVRDFTREEVVGKTPVEIGAPAEELNSVLCLLEERGSVDNFEASLARKGKLAGTILVSAEQLELNGEMCFLFVYNDITEMRHMQLEMARLDRLNLIGQMAAGIAHEIRNPMTTVRGYLQLLTTKPELQAQCSTFDFMITEIDRVNSIITEFLSLARNKPSELCRQSLNGLLRSLYPLLEADAYTQNKQIVFEPGSTPYIPFNAKEISQLVLNLCRNGLEAMKEQGVLSIRTYLENDHVVLCVQDEGYGIPCEYREKLGTPFFTTKENGTGLGLASCYNIAERHNAKIDIESGPGGTTFFVRFPLKNV